MGASAALVFGVEMPDFSIQINYLANTRKMGLVVSRAEVTFVKFSSLPWLQL